jgi:hypothetical protein
MKHEIKTFFYGITAVLIFALVLGACPVDSKTSSDNSSLRLSGQVYIQNTEPFALLLNSANEEFKGNLNISDGGLGGSGKIKNGKLNYSIGIPKQLEPIGERLNYLKNMYSDLEFSSDDVNAAVVALEIIDNDEYSGLLKNSLNVNFNSNNPLNMNIIITIKMVNYIYVDNNLIIKADKHTFDNNDFGFPDLGFPISLTTEEINLSLKKGWNALYSEITAQSNIPPELLVPSEPSDPDSPGPDLSALRPTGNLKMSVGDPGNLNWTLMPSQDSGYDDDDDYYDYEP